MQTAKFLVALFLLLATGYWLLATGYWLLATGYWLQNIFCVFAVEVHLLAIKNANNRLNISNNQALAARSYTHTAYAQLLSKQVA